MQKLEVEGSFSVTQGRSMDPEMKADHWSTRAVLTKDESEGVKGAENEKQGMEVDEVICGTQPSSTTDGGFTRCEVEKNSQQHVSKFKAQEEE